MSAQPDENKIPVPPTPTDDTTNSKSGFRWKTGLVITGLTLVAEVVVWYTANDRTQQIMRSYITFGTFLCAFLLWWFFGSGLSWKTRIKGFGTACLLYAVFKAVFRNEGTYGDFLPRYSLRWSETPEERAERYWNDLPFRFSPPKPIERPPDHGVDNVFTLPTSRHDWPQFRGPNRNGIIPTSVKPDWNQRPPHSQWRHPIGLGWSSFAAVGKKIFTHEQRGEMEVVVCYNRETGLQKWASPTRTRFSHPAGLGGDGPRATPAVHDSRVYALGATGILTCHEAMTGRALWQTNILTDARAENIEHGMTGSPLIVGDKVIVNPGGQNGRGVTAYDRFDGELLWAAGNHPAGYAGVRHETIDGVDQLVVFNGDSVTGHRIEDGAELWHFPWQNTFQINVAQPIVLDDGDLFIGSGYSLGSAKLNIRQKDGKWTVKDAWKGAGNNKFKLKFNDAVYRDGYLYGLDDSILTCVEASTGKRVWRIRTEPPIKYGQLLLLDNALLAMAENGDVILLNVSPEGGKELCRFKALESMTWNHPVIVDNHLLVRNDREAAAYVIRHLDSPGTNQGELP